MDLRRRSEVLREVFKRALRRFRRDLRAQRFDLDPRRLQRLFGLLAAGHLTLNFAFQLDDLASLFLDSGQKRDLLRRRINQGFTCLFQNVSSNFHVAPPAIKPTVHPDLGVRQPNESMHPKTTSETSAQPLTL